jgi:hypothetical protein
MQVHEIEGNSTLKISMNAANCDLVTNVGYSKVGKMWLGNCFIDSFVFSNASEEISFCVLAAHILVIGIARRYF